MKQKTRVWFNKTISSMEDFLFNIKNDKLKEFEFIYTIPNADEKMYLKFKTLSEKNDNIIVKSEPHTTNKKEYLEWCLNFCKENKVDIFVPWRYIESILKDRKLFKKENIKIISCIGDNDLNKFKNVEDKNKFYEITSIDRNIYTPKFFKVNCKEDFFNKYNYLRKELQISNVCMKPTISIFAFGFKKIMEDNEDYNRMIKGWDKYTVGLETLKLIMPDKIKDTLVMELLPNFEYSHDILCSNGKIIVSGMRKKISDTKQEISLDFKNSIMEQSVILVKKFNLNGFINIQYKENEQNIPYVLEINPRMSGGFYKILELFEKKDIEELFLDMFFK